MDTGRLVGPRLFSLLDLRLPCESSLIRLPPILLIAPFAILYLISANISYLINQRIT